MFGVLVTSPLPAPSLTREPGCRSETSPQAQARAISGQLPNRGSNPRSCSPGSEFTYRKKKKIGLFLKGGLGNLDREAQGIFFPKDTFQFATFCA